MAGSDRLNVLVVDDEPQILSVISLVLSRAGYNVLTAGDASQALTAFGAHPVDLVLADVQLPGIDGYQLLERIRGISPGTKVMLTSGYINEDPVPGLPFLAKPFTMVQLLSCVEAALAPRRCVHVRKAGAGAADGC